MIIDVLNIPCPECLAALEEQLLAVPADAVAVGRSVFCPHRGVALTGCVQLGRLTWWQIWPADSPAAAQEYLASAEAAMILHAVAHASRSPRH